MQKKAYVILMCKSIKLPCFSGFIPVLMGFVKVFLKTASCLSWVFSRKDRSISLEGFERLETKEIWSVILKTKISTNYWCFPARPLYASGIFAEPAGSCALLKLISPSWNQRLGKCRVQDGQPNHSFWLETFPAFDFLFREDRRK